MEKHEAYGKALRIDLQRPVRRKRWKNLYIAVWGFDKIGIYRCWHHSLFKHGKPKRLRKAV